jgi:hypothetical protein
VARRMSLTSRSDGVSGDADFCLMPTPQVVTMSPKSSVPQAASLVSQVLMSDNKRERAADTRHPNCLASNLSHNAKDRVSQSTISKTIIDRPPARTITKYSVLIGGRSPLYDDDDVTHSHQFSQEIP